MTPSLLALLAPLLIPEYPKFLPAEFPSSHPMFTLNAIRIAIAFFFRPSPLHEPGFCVLFEGGGGVACNVRRLTVIYGTTRTSTQFILIADSVWWYSMILRSITLVSCRLGAQQTGCEYPLGLSVISHYTVDRHHQTCLQKSRYRGHCPAFVSHCVVFVKMGGVRTNRHLDLLGMFLKNLKVSAICAQPHPQLCYGTTISESAHLSCNIEWAL